VGGGVGRTWWFENWEVGGEVKIGRWGVEVGGQMLWILNRDCQ